MDQRAGAAGLPPWKELYGPSVVASILSSVLTGIVIVITVWYYRTHRKDSYWSKGVVGLLLVVSTLDTIFLSMRAIQLTVLHPADLIYFLNLRARPNEVGVIITTDMCALIALGFMSWRVVSFARRMRMTYSTKMTVFFWVICVMIGIGWCGCFGLSVYQVHLLRGYSSYLELYSSNKSTTIFQTITTAQIATFLFMDSILMISLTVIFHQAKTGFSSTNPILDALINNTLRNGGLITTCQITALVLNQVGQLLWAILPGAIIGKVYVLTVLSILIRPRQVQKNLQKKFDLEALSPDGEGIIATEQSLGTSGSGTGSTSLSIANVKCQACGSTSTAIMFPGNGKGNRLNSLNPQQFSTPPSGELGIQFRNRDRDTEGNIGFQAALLDLDEASDEKHEMERSEGEKGDEKERADETRDHSGALHVTGTTKE